MCDRTLINKLHEAGKTNFVMEDKGPQSIGD